MKRFFVEWLGEKDTAVLITGRELHHLKHVLRLKKGDHVILFDGKGHESFGDIESVGKNEACITVRKKSEALREGHLDITLAQGLVKGEKMDLIIQKATELGVSRIIPFVTSRTIPKIESEQPAKKMQRWQRIAMEAAKQCGRSRVPGVEEIKTFAEVLDGWGDYIKIIPWEGEGRNTLKDILRSKRSAGSVVLIGPEGGFSDAEIAEAKERGFVSVTLGPRILRTETAAISVLAIMQYELGDMGEITKALTKGVE
ncbi:MAG: 16S rRNA (uracil(1498)-N(3))-methyltransferase [Deltaproteobacteria bacterium]|nr:16S rRNA (uracil(1498)-N(3))-methyltransferase [Deltaproteobacteria bacterium]